LHHRHAVCIGKPFARLVRTQCDRNFVNDVLRRREHRADASVPRLAAPRDSTAAKRSVAVAGHAQGQLIPHSEDNYRRAGVRIIHATDVNIPFVGYVEQS
jgi:hypothetical protein